MGKHLVLETNQLCKSFKGKTVVNEVSFGIEKGDVFGFLGPNGAGKTTTIRMIVGLIKADSGSVKINGSDINKNFINAISNVGAVIETPKFYSYLSAYRNLALIKNLHPKVPVKRIEEVLEMVGLLKRASDKVETYSLGMKQRLGIARALLHYPNLVILDEPTNGLDPQGMKEVREMISQLAIEQDITFLISSHLLNEVEQICNKVAILRQGQVIAKGTVKELLAKENETVELRTKEVNKSMDVLKNVPFVKTLTPHPFGLDIEMDKGYSSKIIYILFSNHITVDYLIPKRESFEQFFIELTEEKGGGQIG